MNFPMTRPRRLRRTPFIRSMVRESRLSLEQLITPLFVVPGSAVRSEISSMPGQYQLSVDEVVRQTVTLRELGLSSVLLFAVPESKDEIGSSSWDPHGLIPQTIAAIKKETPDTVVVTDLCFCEYTSHGHCGVMRNGELQNDATLENLAKQALVHAEAGADIIAPSGMLDGMIGTLRTALDGQGFEQIPLMSYAAKFASAFYGPFREAAQSTPEYGDRRAYQMDPANLLEAMREVALDIEEGADIVMVKPALAFLDIVREVKQRFEMPTAVYNVSGEYSMVKAAERNGWMNGTQLMLECLTSMRRAGADIIITYFAEEYARLMRSSG